jgi:hypothetical protein
MGRESADFCDSIRRLQDISWRSSHCPELFILYEQALIFPYLMLF